MRASGPEVAAPDTVPRPVPFLGALWGSEPYPALGGSRRICDTPDAAHPQGLGRRAALSLGGVAQLGERLLCKQEVIGSIPFTSTISRRLMV
jgi:hypothetical protein